MSYRRSNDGPGQEVAPSTAGASGAGDHGRPDLFGGHEFAYESHTDLFRCVKCHRYEVTIRKTDDTMEPCDGIPPAGSGPIEVNMF